VEFKEIIWNSISTYCRTNKFPKLIYPLTVDTLRSALQYLQPSTYSKAYGEIERCVPAEGEKRSHSLFGTQWRSTIRHVSPQNCTQRAFRERNATKKQNKTMQQQPRCHSTCTPPLFTKTTIHHSLVQTLTTFANQFTTPRKALELTKKYVL
jgi:hypothetical protein